MLKNYSEIVVVMTYRIPEDASYRGSETSGLIPKKKKKKCALLRKKLKLNTNNQKGPNKDTILLNKILLNKQKLLSIIKSFKTQKTFLTQTKSFV